MRKFVPLVFSSFLIFSLAACNMSLKGGRLTVPLSLDEKAVTRLITGVQNVIAAANPNQLKTTVNNIDFIEPDSIRVDGTYELSTGETVPGSMTIAFGVADGKPRAEVISLDVPGMEGVESVQEQINRALETALQQEIEVVQEAAVFKSITVENNTLRIVVEVPLRQT